MVNFIKNNKKEIIAFFILIIASCLYVFLSSDFYYKGDDLAYHLNRLQGISEAFKDGQIIPRIYPSINYGFGYGSALFYCDFFLYPFVLLNLIGVSILNVYKIIVVFYTAVAIILSMYFSKKVFKSSFSSIFCACLFTLSNYRLYDVYNRAALGEFIVISFIPFILYSIYQTLVLKEDNYINLALAFSSLVLSHLISSVLFGVIFFIFIIIFIVCNLKNKEILLKVIKTIIKATILAIAICSWFLLPMLEQIRSQDFYCFSFDNSFDVYPRVEQLNNLINPINGLNIFDITLLVFSFAYIFTKKNKVISIIFISSIVLFLIMIGFIPLTHHINFIQFMFRLNIIIYPLLIIIVLYICKEKPKLKVCYYLLLVLTFINLFSKYNILFNDTEKIIKVDELGHYLVYDDEKFYYNRRQICGGEYLPVCDNADYYNGEKNIILEDKLGYRVGIMNDFDRSYTHISFSYDGEAEFVSLPLTYYKGYTVLCDNKKIQCIDDFLFKRVGFYLQPGLHNYSVHYGGTLVQYASCALSILSFVFVSIRLFYKRKLTKNHI